MEIALGLRLGKKTNSQKLIDVCQLCHNTAELESYEATEFFHIYFLPIIPLGKKKIINKCSHCGNYREMSYRRWQEHRLKKMTNAKDMFEQHDNTETAILLYEVTLQCGSVDEVGKIKSFLLDRFPDDVILRSRIEKTILLPSVTDELAHKLHRNLKDEGTDENTRYVLGWGYYNNKEYDKAYSVLISINPIKIRRDFYLLVDLAKKVDVTSAYKILIYLSKNHPALANRHDQLQKMIFKYEKELNIPKEKSISPVEFAKYRRTQAIIIIGCILVATILAILYYLENV